MIAETTRDETEQTLQHIIEKIESGISLGKNEMSQDMFDSLYAYAYHLYQNGKYEKSQSFFRFLTLLNIKEPKFWMGLGASDQMLQNYNAAIESYNIALRLNEANPYAYFVIADCYIATGLIGLALEFLETAERLFGDQEKYKNLMTHIEIIRQAWDKHQLENKNE
jgi:type III secretion system low calcium response chaperone LcrH/SycD